MDATALRWVLAIIGIVFIVGIYVYTQYQNKLRKRSAIRTFTREELEVDFIEDDLLREELSHINVMLDENLEKEDLSAIRINPALDLPRDEVVRDDDPVESQSLFTLPAPVFKIDDEYLIAYVLKPMKADYLSGEALQNAFRKAGFEEIKSGTDQGFYRYADIVDSSLMLANMTSTGSFENIEDEAFSTLGILCYFDTRNCDQPRDIYELMLKKVDELVRLLNLKVYDQNLQLLTVQHVTDIRDRLKIS